MTTSTGKGVWERTLLLGAGQVPEPEAPTEPIGLGLEDIGQALGDISSYLQDGLNIKVGVATVLNQAKLDEYGITLDEGWQLELAPGGDGGLTANLIAPDGWKVTQLGEYVTPDGWTMTEAGYVSPEGETFSAEELQEGLDFETAISRLFPETNSDEVVRAIIEDPQAWLERLKEKGRTDDTETVLAGLGLTDDDINMLYGQVRPWTVTEGMRWHIGQTAVPVPLQAAAQSVSRLFELIDQHTWQPVYILQAEQALREQLREYETGQATPSSFEMVGMGGGAFTGEAIEMASTRTPQPLTESDKEFLARLDELKQQFGSTWAMTEQAKAAWDEWQGMPSQAKMIAEMSNPVYFFPIEGAAMKLLGLVKYAPKLGKYLGAGLKGVAACERGSGPPITNVFNKAGKVGKYVRVPVADVPAAAETLSFIEKAHPGRLGMGLMGKLKRLGTVEKTVKGARLVQVHADEIGAAAADYGVSQLQRVVNIDRALGIKGGWVTKGIKAAAKGAPTIKGKPSMAWGDVFEYFRYYTFADPKVKAWLELAHALIDDVGDLAAKNGVELHQKLYPELAHYFPRHVTGLEKVLEENIVRVGAALPGSKVSALKPRVLDLMAEGLEAGYKYATPAESLQAYIHGIYRLIGNQQAIGILKPFLKPLPKETKAGAAAIRSAEQARRFAAQITLAKSLLQRLRRGERLTGAHMRFLQQHFPWAAEAALRVTTLRLARAAKVTEGALGRRLEKIAKTAWREAKEVSHAERVQEARAYRELRITSHALTGILRSVDRQIRNLTESLAKSEKRLLGVPAGSKRALAAAEKLASQMEGLPALKRTRFVLDAHRQIADALAKPHRSHAQKLAAIRALAAKSDAPDIFHDFLGTVESSAEIGPRRSGVVLGARVAAPLDVERFVKDIVDDALDAARAIEDAAKEVAGQVSAKKASLVERLSRATFTEGMSDLPAFRNRIFADIMVNGKRYTGRQVANMVTKAFRDRAAKWIELPATANRGSVTLVAALDTSAPFIQGIYALGLDLVNWVHLRPSFIWAKSAVTHVWVMLNPKWLSGFRARNARVYMKYTSKGLITASDLTDYYKGMGVINNTMGRLATLAERVPAIGKGLAIVPKIPKVLYGRTSIGFAAWGEVARIEIIKSLERAWLRAGGTTQELVEFANVMTGVVSTKAMGVGATQRAMESAGLFAPRYLRANLMFLRMLFRGGMTGKMAREVLAGTAAGWMAAYCAISAAMGQDPKLNPAPKEFGGDGAEFLTVEVGGSHIGIPGFLYGFVKMMTGVIAIGVNDPHRLITIDKETVLADHPEFRWLLSKASPLVNLTREMATGRDFMGNRLESGNDYLEVVAEKFLSIALQAVITQDPPATVGVFGAEVLGLRTFPESQWEMFYDLSDEILFALPDDMLSDKQLQLRADGTLGWKDMSQLQQEQLLEQFPEMAEAYNAAITASERRETDTWRQWGIENDRINSERDQAEAALLDQLRADGSTMSMAELRQAIGDISSESYTKRQELEKRFPTIYEEFDKEREEGTEDVPLVDQAYNEWYDYVMNGPGTHDDQGNAIWSVIEARKREWMDKWGEDYFDYILDVREYGYGDKDDLLFKIWEDKQRLWEYWAITDELGNTDAAGRLAYRQDPDNLDMEAALIFLGYVSTIQNPEAEEIVKGWCQEYDVPLSAIPAFSKWMIPEQYVTQYSIEDAEAYKKYSQMATEGYDRKWYLQDNPGFYQYWVEVLGHQPIEFDRIPTRDEYPLLVKYDEIPAGNARLKARCESRDLDAALVRVRGLKAAYGTDRCAFGVLS